MYLLEENFRFAVKITGLASFVTLTITSAFIRSRQLSFQLLNLKLLLISVYEYKPHYSYGNYECGFFHLKTQIFLPFVLYQSLSFKDKSLGTSASHKSFWGCVPQIRLYTTKIKLLSSLLFPIYGLFKLANLQSLACLLVEAVKDLPVIGVLKWRR